MNRRRSGLAVSLSIVLGLALGPALLILVALAGRLPSDSRAPPPGWESGIGRRAVAASLRVRAAGLTSPIAADDQAALRAGLGLYSDNCAGCHGSRRGPSSWGSGGFYPRVPQFWQERIDVTPAEAFVAVRDGIRYSGMGAWRGMMSEADMWRVANFVSRIHALPPGVAAEPGPAPRAR